MSRSSTTVRNSIPYALNLKGRKLVAGQLKIFGGGAQRPPVCQGLLVIEASRSHSDTPRSVGLLWTSDQPDTEPSTHNTNNRQTSMPPGGIRTHNPSQRADSDPRLRPRGHWDRRSIIFLFCFWRDSSPSGPGPPHS
jgi:hypothetical protein